MWGNTAFLKALARDTQYTLPEFTALRRQMKAEVVASSQLFQSSQRGKTSVQVLEAMLAADAELARDPEVESMDLAVHISEQKAMASEAKQLIDSEAPRLSFKRTREEGWTAWLQGVVDKQAKWEKATTEFGLLIDMVRDVQMGVLKDKRASARRENYKVTRCASCRFAPMRVRTRIRNKPCFACRKRLCSAMCCSCFVVSQPRARYVKAFKAGGFCNVASRHFGTLAGVAIAGVTPCDETPSLKHSTLQRASADPASQRFAYARAYATKGLDTILSEAVALDRLTRGASIMKPLSMTLDGLPSIDDEFAHSLDHAVHRPWLVMTLEGRATWGPLKYPQQGFPAVLTSLDDFAFVGCVPMRLVLGKSQSMESPAGWFADDMVDPKDVDWVTLGKGDALLVPFGMAILWGFAPSDGKLEVKPAKCRRGKLLAQWLLPKDLAVSDEDAIVAKDMKRNWAKLMASRGSQTPWSVYRDALTTWVEAIASA